MLHFFVFILFIFLLFFLSPINTYAEDESPTATPSAEIRLDITDSPPSPVVIGSEFSISISLTNALPNTTYYFKPRTVDSPATNYFYYGCNDSDGWCYYNSAFADLPNLITDLQGSVNGSLILKFQPDKPVQTDYKIVVNYDSVKPEGSNLWEESYNVVVVQTVSPTNIPVPTSVSTSTPTPTPTPTTRQITNTPTRTPTPTRNISNTLTPTRTSTPKPTSTPTKYPTSTLKPTLTPTLSVSPSLTDTIIDTPTLKPSPEILGDYDDIAETISFISPTATPSSILNQANIFNFIPYFLITAGGGLLMTPTLITKLKKK